jgi:hypothetical protein
VPARGDSAKRPSCPNEATLPEVGLRVPGRLGRSTRLTSSTACHSLGPRPDHVELEAPRPSRASWQGSHNHQAYSPVCRRLGSAGNTARHRLHLRVSGALATASFISFSEVPAKSRRVICTLSAGAGVSSRAILTMSRTGDGAYGVTWWDGREETASGRSKKTGQDAQREAGSQRREARGAEGCSQGLGQQVVDAALGRTTGASWALSVSRL